MDRSLEPTCSPLLTSSPLRPVPRSADGARFIIQGRLPLQGEVRVSGAKNAVLPAMAAALLTSEPVIIEGVPRIEDVAILSEVLVRLGARVEWLDASTLVITADQIHSFHAPSELVKKMRASFLVVGPLLARFGEGASCPPGGDVIGQRPIDVHLVGFMALGAEVRFDGEVYWTRASKLRGRTIFMDYPSHIGTENLLMAATLAEGQTIIRNASAEPEVVDLAKMLTAMGAKIRGAGTSTIEVEGVERLRGVRHRVIPDRIEAGTFALAAAATAGDVWIENVQPRHLDALLWKLGEMGVRVEERESVLRVDAREGRLRSTNVQCLPYPGYPTDLQATIGAVLTQADGLSVVHERVYDNRLLHVAELRRLGAEIEVSGQTAVIRGPVALAGTTVRALDIRSGAALVIAGLAAYGRTEVLDINHLDRGYEAIDVKLRQLGARIERRPLAA
ncbi:MAG: UDP-N-acetylglucosamine 1-carboxyvinyltransferase [Chloroflexota bacterium]|nr:UDP-N-acetylglucosamine 1-carboxyvinyltransferase [Dehalococcoidia bacterium]MDW8254315.1 UDP-N-acetylglucosamine 1-carboxyvinyltransferase [Chloroflexota bacterium]